MILSVSRRTDIPRFYMDWFLNRLEAGFVLVRNPMNHQQVSRVALTADTIDCIAFWSKNPAPMLDRLPLLEPYPYFIQFTLNPYGREIESGLPEKARLVDTFRRLAAAIGPERMVWRYSPIVFGGQHTVAWHLRAFEQLARQLAGSTGVCRLGYLEMYRKITPRMRSMGLREAGEDEKLALTEGLVEIGRAHGIALGGCGNLNLEAVGFQREGCISAAAVARAMGEAVAPAKDPNQPATCSCMPSVEVGAYNTCLNGCAYCYANQSVASAEGRARGYDPQAPMLCDTLRLGDRVTERKMPLLGSGQLSLL